MSRIANKTTLYAVMRRDFSGQDCLIAVCKTPDAADNLVGEYEQMFWDKGFHPNEVYFYSTGTIFYDR